MFPVVYFQIMNKLIFVLSDATLNNLTYVDETVSVHPSASVLVTQKNKHVVIDCPVISNARILEYFWTKDGVDIIPQKRVDIAANGSLIITKIINKRRKGRNDTGYYECYARNKHGTFIGQQLDLIIASKLCRHSLYTYFNIIVT